MRLLQHGAVMRRSIRLLRGKENVRRVSSRTASKDPPVVKFDNATFYRRQPIAKATSNEESSQTSLFPNTNFSIESTNAQCEYWAIIGPTNYGKTTFLELLRGQHLPFPPSARSFPYLSTEEIEAKDHRLRFPGNAIRYVGFDNKPSGLSGMGTYMSARYESRRESTDFSLLDYLKGNTQLNPEETSEEKVDNVLLENVMKSLRLGDLASMPVANLSNGQSRRARIAQALLLRPEVLLLDEPFMGLDPPTTVQLSSLLHGLARSNNPRILLSLRPQDAIPDWITHVLFLGKALRVTQQGSRRQVALHLEENLRITKKGKKAELDSNVELTRYSPNLFNSLMGTEEQEYAVKLGRPRKPLGFTRVQHVGEPLIEMQGVSVKYGEKEVLGGRTSKRHSDGSGLYWTVRQGQRWAVVGPNGSGKTTLLSLITSDHPQAYALPIKFFGRSRLPSTGVPGISLFELQSRIGHSSPEVHSFFPRSISVRAALESAFAATPLSKPNLTSVADERIDAFLRWFQEELNPRLGMDPDLRTELYRSDGERRKEYSMPMGPEKFRRAYNEYWYERHQEQSENVSWADDLTVGDLTFGAQRVALFLRALVRYPDIIILDEAFSGMDDYIRDKCLLFLEVGETKLIYPDEAAENTTNSFSGRKTRDRYIIDFRNDYFKGLRDEQALVCVSHIKEEIPNCVRDWIYLPESASGESYRIGTVESKPIRDDASLWENIWFPTPQGKK